MIETFCVVVVIVASVVILGAMLLNDCNRTEIEEGRQPWTKMN